MLWWPMKGLSKEENIMNIDTQATVLDIAMKKLQAAVSTALVKGTRVVEYSRAKTRPRRA